jgi:hypothetical protein
MELTEIVSTPLIQFSFKALAGAAGSILVSIFLIIRHPEPSPSIEWKPRYFLRHLILSAISGVIVASIPALPAPRFAFLAGALAPLLWEYLFVPASERAEFERTRVMGMKQALTDAEAAVVNEPDKAKPVWDLSRAQMELYVQKNLRQVGQIFWITVVVMAAGFSLVAFGAWKAFDSRLDAALLTAGAGVLTQAIGAGFLLIYKATISQASRYVEMLERINAVGMAVNIVDLIPDKDDSLKNHARTDLVKLILSQNSLRSRSQANEAAHGA